MSNVIPLSIRRRPIQHDASGFSWKGNTGLAEASALGIPLGAVPEAVELVSPKTGVSKIFHLHEVHNDAFYLRTLDKKFEVIILNT